MTDLGTVALGLSGVSLAGLMALARSYGKLETKVDTLWEFLLRRGVAEGRMSDVLRQNSPISLQPNMVEKLSPFTEELRAFYNNGASRMTEVEEAMELERRFGDRFAKHICLPLNIFGGACIVAAMIYGRSLVGVEKPSVLSSGFHKVAEREI